MSSFYLHFPSLKLFEESSLVQNRKGNIESNFPTEWNDYGICFCISPALLNFIRSLYVKSEKDKICTVHSGFFAIIPHVCQSLAVCRNNPEVVGNRGYSNLELMSAAIG